MIRRAGAAFISIISFLTPFAIAQDQSKPDLEALEGDNDMDTTPQSSTEQQLGT